MSRFLGRLFGEDLVIDFSYSWAAFPEHGDTGHKLLEKANQTLINERDQRLAKTIMLVDDEPAVVKALRRVLTQAEYNNFIEANSGQEVLEKLKDTVPDLIILDMKMPRMSGYEVIGRIKENVATKDVPVL